MQDQEPIKLLFSFSKPTFLFYSYSNPQYFLSFLQFYRALIKGVLMGKKTIDVSHTSCTLYSNDCEMTLFIRSALTMSGNALIN